MNESDLSLYALLVRETKASLFRNARFLEIRFSGHLWKAQLILKLTGFLLSRRSFRVQPEFQKGTEVLL